MKFNRVSGFNAVGAMLVSAGLFCFLLGLLLQATGHLTRPGSFGMVIFLGCFAAILGLPLLLIVDRLDFTEPGILRTSKGAWPFVKEQEVALGPAPELHLSVFKSERGAYLVQALLYYQGEGSPQILEGKQVHNYTENVIALAQKLGARVYADETMEELGPKWIREKFAFAYQHAPLCPPRGAFRQASIRNSTSQMLMGALLLVIGLRFFAYGLMSTVAGDLSGAWYILALVPGILPLLWTDCVRFPHANIVEITKGMFPFAKRQIIALPRERQLHFSARKSSGTLVNYDVEFRFGDERIALRKGAPESEVFNLLALAPTIGAEVTSDESMGALGPTWFKRKYPELPGLEIVHDKTVL